VLAIWPAATELLQFDRQQIAKGELWRFITCHLTHWSFEQLFWDAAVFAILAVVCMAQSRLVTWMCLAISALVIPATVWVCSPEMSTYRGLSGLDSALFVALVAMLLRRSLADGDWWLGALAGGLGAAFAAKTLFELTTGETLFVDSAGAAMVPVPLAHLVGAVVGGVCGAVFSVNPPFWNAAPVRRPGVSCAWLAPRRWLGSGRRFAGATRASCRSPSRAVRDPEQAASSTSGFESRVLSVSDSPNHPADLGLKVSFNPASGAGNFSQHVGELLSYFGTMMWRTALPGHVHAVSGRGTQVTSNGRSRPCRR
jgi:rhomboid family GlyGly-CTERM serine protease